MVCPGGFNFPSKYLSVLLISSLAFKSWILYNLVLSNLNLHSLCIELIKIYFEPIEFSWEYPKYNLEIV